MSAVNAVVSQPCGWLIPCEPRVEPPNGTSRPITSAPADYENFEPTVLSSPLGPEGLLIRRAIASDERAFEELVAKHTPRLRRIAYNLLFSREDAEEAVQDALLSAYRNLKSFRGQSAFSSWLTKIVINAAKMTRRKNSRHREVSLDEMLDAEPRQKPPALVPPGQDPEQACEAGEFTSLIDQELRQLSPKLQEALRLSDIEGLSTEACFVSLGVRRDAFKSRAVRARHRLASSLRPMLLRRQAEQLSARK